MKSVPMTLLGLTLLAGLLASAPSRADPSSCEVPAYLLLTESPLKSLASAPKMVIPAKARVNRSIVGVALQSALPKTT